MSANYDNNNDGTIDMVFFYYAGYNEAETGPENSIWPHQGTITTGEVFSGKRLSLYACTSELRGSSGTEMCGIGTFAHEFGHILGLKDTYDIDGAVNGYSTGLFTFDIMSGGNYNNQGRTPPFYPAVHRMQLGWLSPKVLPENSNINLKPLAENEAYIAYTSSDGEYYLFEYRDENNNIQRNWDKYIGYDNTSNTKIFTSDGLLITHIDKSNNLIAGLAAKDFWANNMPNLYLPHECARLVMSGNKKQIASYADTREILFPGAKNVTEFGQTTTPGAVDWKGYKLLVNLKNIKINSDNISFFNDIKSFNSISYTNSLLIDWFSYSSDFNILWKTKNDSEYKTSNSKTNTFVIRDLLPKTSYDIIVKDGTNGQVITKQELQTTALNTNKSPKILYGYSKDSGTDFFDPIVNNTESNKFKWYLNGEAVEPNGQTRLGYGNYIIKCEIEKEKKEYIVKFMKAQ